MAISVGDLTSTLSLNDTFSAGLGRAADLAKDVGGQITDLFGLEIPAAVEIGGAAIAAGAVVIAGLTATIVELGAHGSEVEDISNNFTSLTASMGTNGQAINALRTSTMGLVSDLTLMQSANKALSAGWQATASDMATVGEAAVVLAKRVGLEGGTAQAYKDLMEAMTTGRTRGLGPELGVFVDLTTATDALGGATKALGSSMQTEAGVEDRRAALLKTLSEKIQEAGAQSLNFQDRLTLAKVGLTNFVDALSEAAAKSPALNTALQAIDQALLQTFGTDRQQTVNLLAGYIDKFAIGLVKGAGVSVTALDYLGTSLYYIAAADNVVTVAQDLLVQKVLEVAQAMAIANEITDGFSKTSVFAANLVTDALKAMTAGVKSHADATAQDIAAGVAWDTKAASWAKTLQDLATKMQNATAVETEHTAAVHAGVGATAQASAADQERALKIGEWEKATGLLDIEIKNALEHGDSLREVTDEFGAAAHKAAVEATNLDIPLAAIPNRVYDIDDAFKSATIADAIAKLNEQAQKAETHFVGINEKATDLAASHAWDSMKTGLDQLVNLGQQWGAVFTTVTDQITVKANQQRAALAAAWASGQLGAEDYAIALIEVDQLEQRAKADAGFQQWASGLAQIGSEVSSIGADLPGFVGSFVKGMGDAISASGQLVKSLQDVHDATSLLGTIGGVIGIVGSIVSIGKAIGSALGIGSTAGRDAVTAFANSMGGYDALHAKLDATGDAGETMWMKLGQVGQGNADQAKAIIGQVTDYLNKADAAAAKLAQDQADNAQTQQDLNADISKYHVTIQQLGPAWKQQNLTAEAQDLISSYTRLTKAGVTMNDTVSDMSGELLDAAGNATGLNQLLNDAIATGASLPDQFKPILQKMIDMGDAVDSNGKKITDLSGVSFSATLDEQFQTLIDKIDTLVDKLTNSLTPALNSLPSPTVTVNYAVNGGGDNGAPAKGGASASDVTGGAGGPLDPDSNDWGLPVGDSPLMAVTGPGAVLLRPGDIYGMPKLTAGIGATATPLANAGGGSGDEIHLHVHLDNVTVSDQGKTPLEAAEEVVDAIIASSRLKTAVVNRVVKPIFTQQGIKLG
jgi:hypothetical protein